MGIFSKIKNSKLEDRFFITWENLFSENEIKTIGEAKRCLDDYRNQLNHLIACQRSEFIKAEFKLKIHTIDKSEFFKAVPCFSFFNTIRDEIQIEYDEFLTELVILALTKFSFLISKKFYEIVEEKFPNNRMNQSPFLRLVEIMKKESVNGIEEIINKSTLFIGINNLGPETIQEIIDLGYPIAHFWSRMFKEAVELTYETFSYEREYGPLQETRNFSTIDVTQETVFDEEVEDFISKTQTLIVDEIALEALNFFKLNKLASKDDFKKAYRKLSKKYHPDLNKSPDAEKNMQKINLYKFILEEYFS